MLVWLRSGAAALFFASLGLAAPASALDETGPTVEISSAPAVPSAEEAPQGDAQPESDPDFDEFESTQSTAALPGSWDPLRGYNRAVFAFNDRFYFYLAKPIARGYGFVLPKVVRVGINKGFHNFRFPLRFVNCILQFKVKKAGTELGRFVVNSSLGIGGLFDPADKWFKWRRPSEEDFGQTLAFYGVGDGFPLVLPLLGQSNLRDAVGLAPGYLVNPLHYVADWETSLAVGTGEELNYISLHIGDYESIKKDALDPYSFIRDAYKQNRDKKIRE